MKFKSTKLDLGVSTPNGFIFFKNGSYETTDKKVIDTLKKIKDVQSATVKKEVAKEPLKED